jgi:hypothetical protein
MKCILLAAAPLPVEALAQSADAEIQRAVLAAPARQRADATVLSLRPDGSIAVLRQGSNGLICWDNTVRAGYDNPIDSQCTTEANRERLAQNHTFQTAGGTADDIKARFDQAEANGTRAVSQFGSIYYHVTGDTPDALRTHTTVAVPFATGESLGGLPTRGGPALLWLMEAGLSSAHLMVSGM